ncbi:DNA polymerase III subunit delta' [Virgibacillus halodenitrificans]|uniref:DNA polymerase III subunit delta' n=1 Tax=Virgibacillus halodenitrificans TaxID=1482 RepID=UPI000EF518E0|nr:DNA polymerase III subunit delta' [Virgibacillus halodenitrificans]
MILWKELEKTQPIVVQTFKNAFQRDRVAHAYLLEGPQGTGKVDTAYLFVKNYFCRNLNNTEPCLECDNCKRIESRNHPDVLFIEPEGLTIKKEQIQTIQKESSFSGFESEKKVFIINQADKMSASAANSLLKFIEEPNKGTVVILITEEVHRMLDTIISRCQLLPFKPLPHSLFIQQLIEEGVPSNNARLIASLTNNLQEGTEMNEDPLFGKRKELVVQFAKEVYSGSLNAFIRISDFLEQFKEKEEVQFGIDLLTLFYKDFLYAQAEKMEKTVYVDEWDYFLRECKGIKPTVFANKITSIINAKKRIFSNVSPQAVLEQIVVDLQK